MALRFNYIHAKLHMRAPPRERHGLRVRVAARVELSELVSRAGQDSPRSKRLRGRLPISIVD